MSAGGARRGRRDNGLDAAEYAVAGDVDPRIGEHLLDVLAAGGIAAYLQPSADLNPITRTTTVPSRPVDRLYVDRSHLAVAREYLTQLTHDALPAPEALAEPDIDAEWARIVASFDTAPDGDPHPWPSAEDLTPQETSAETKETATPPGTARRLPWAADVSGVSVGSPPPDEPSLLDALDTFGAGLPDEIDEQYVPPPPPPLPHVSKFAALAVVSITVGFVLFIFPSLLPVDREVATLLGFTGVLAGFVTLIWRLRPGDKDEDDPEHGAVV